MILSITRDAQERVFDVDTTEDAGFEDWCLKVTLAAEQVRAVCPPELTDDARQLIMAAAEISDAFDVTCVIDTHSPRQASEVRSLPLEDAFVSVRVKS